MTKTQAKKLFEQYNPAGKVVRCPSGRAKMRKPLDIYAKAAVNLYGIIKLQEFAEIFNAQNEEKTTGDEVYTILLPNVLKSGWYGFYKDYIVHYLILRDFDWVQYLELEQGDKPRYIPPKEQFIQYAWEDYDDFDYWQDVHMYIVEKYGYNENTRNGFDEIKDYLTLSVGINEIGAILDKYHFVLDNQQQAQEFFDLLMLAANNTRKWHNKGHTPNEMMKLFAPKRQKEPIINQPRNVGQNERCPCGSGKKFKHCCVLIEAFGKAQLSYNECELFYNTWYKLLYCVNLKLNIVNINIKKLNDFFQDDTKLYKIREKLWKNPQLIGEFVNNADDLSNDEINFWQLWGKRHIKGKFLLVKYESEYAILMRMDEGEDHKLYAVKGLKKSIAEMMHRQLPVMLETVLLPFGDKIIYDSFMTSHTVSFGDGIRAMFEDEFARAKDMFGIITKLV